MYYCHVAVVADDKDDIDFDIVGLRDTAYDGDFVVAAAAERKLDLHNVVVADAAECQ